MSAESKGIADGTITVIATGFEDEEKKALQNKNEDSERIWLAGHQLGAWYVLQMLMRIFIIDILNLQQALLFLMKE